MRDWYYGASLKIWWLYNKFVQFLNLAFKILSGSHNSPEWPFHFSFPQFPTRTQTEVTPFQIKPIFLLPRKVSCPYLKFLTPFLKSQIPQNWHLKKKPQVQGICWGSALLPTETTQGLEKHKEEDEVRQGFRTSARSLRGALECESYISVCPGLRTVLSRRPLAGGGANTNPVNLHRSERPTNTGTGAGGHTKAGSQIWRTWAEHQPCQTVAAVQMLCFQVIDEVALRQNNQIPVGCWITLRAQFFLCLMLCWFGHLSLNHLKNSVYVLLIIILSQIPILVAYIIRYMMKSHWFEMRKQKPLNRFHDGSTLLHIFL